VHVLELFGLPHFVWRSRRDNWEGCCERVIANKGQSGVLVAAAAAAAAVVVEEEEEEERLETPRRSSQIETQKGCPPQLK
jgi:hypothetical protein